MRTYSFVSYEVYTEWRNCFFVNRSTVHAPYFALVVVTDFLKTGIFSPLFLFSVMAGSFALNPATNRSVLLRGFIILKVE